MADAEIIPIGTRGRPGRGTGKARPSSSARNLAPKPRSAGRRPQPVPGQAPQPLADAAGGAGAAAKKPPPRRASRAPSRPSTAYDAPTAQRPAATTQDRGATPGIPVGDWLAAIETGARDVFGDDWEAGLARLPGLPAAAGDR